MDELLRTRLRHPSNTSTNNAAIAAFLDASFVTSAVSHSPTAAVPPSTAVDPAVKAAVDAADKAVDNILVRLHKSLLICEALKLSRADLRLLRTSATDKNGFKALDFNTLLVPLDTVSPSVIVPAKIDDFEQLLRLAQLRGIAPGAGDLLHQYAALNFFPPSPPAAWNAEAVYQLLMTGLTLTKDEVEAAANQLRITTADQYRDPILLTRLIELLIALKQLGATVDQATGLTAPSPDDAAAIGARELLRSKYGESQWHDLIKPIADTLRERQRNALVDFLVARDGLSGVNDLYERYLIDVQTGSCLKTTRLLQATAAAQLFVQRVILNLESGLSLTADKRALWDWMHSYRVWEANRKVFLFPENWLLPELRDDKTAIFRQMESVLSEHEPSPENTRAALLGYLDDLGDLAQISVIAMYEDQQNIGTKEKPVWKETLYVIGRTPNEPYRYFWRSCAEFGSTKMSWSGWEALDLDNANDFIMPFVFEGDLHIAWPIFRKKVDDKNEDNLLWEVQIAWMRRTTHGWVKRKIGKTQLDNVTRLPNKDESRSFSFRLTKDVSTVSIPGSKLPLLQEKITINCYAANEVNPTPPFIPDPTLADVKDSDPVHYSDESVQDNVNFSMRGVAYEYAIVDQTNDIKKYSPVVGMSVWLQYQHQSGPFSGGWYDYKADQPTNPVKTDSHGKFTFQLNSQPLGKQVYNKGLVRLTFWWPNSAPTSFTKRLVDTNGLGYKDWDWNFTIGKENKGIANEYLPNRAVVYKTAGSFTIESGRDLRLGPTPPPFKPLLAYPPVDGNRLSTPPELAVIGAPFPLVSFDDDGVWLTPPRLLIAPLVITRATQPSAPKPLSSPLPTPIWYLQEKDSGFFLQKQVDGWHVWPDGQPFASSYRSAAALSTSDLFHPAIQKYLHYYAAANKFERDAAYANYNWELFLHAPLAIADYLVSQQRFEDARRWLHAVFNPTTGEKDTKTNLPQFWRFLPFHNDSQPDSIEQMLIWLADPDTTDPDFKPTAEFETFEAKFGYQIKQWQENPFMPHMVARLRPSAYQWHTFFAYLDVLIGWGDQLFRRDTRESVNEATLLYVLAAKLLGPRPRVIPAPTPPPPQTYRSLQANKLDAFSNAWVSYSDLPGVRKLTSRTAQRASSSQAQVMAGVISGTAITVEKTPPKTPVQILASLSTLAFCIPQNEKVTEFYDRVENRLFNVRNCREH